MEILPAIIPQSFEDLVSKLRIVKGLCTSVQIDITDGVFVPNASWPYDSNTSWSEFQRIAFGEEQALPLSESFFFEADLMVKSPEKRIEDWISAGFGRLIIHFESTDQMESILESLQGRTEVGMAVEIETPEEEWMPFVKDVGVVQFMGIAQIGVQGEPFDERVIPKIGRFKERYPGVTISVDGGVSLKNGQSLLSAGANRLISGSAIYESTDKQATIQEFQNMKP